MPVKQMLTNKLIKATLLSNWRRGRSC